MAVHESGHALVALLSEHADPVAKITILPAGRALGVTEQLPAAGYYFSPDPHQGNYKKPLPSQAIDKYNDIPGVSRVFDDGTIVIYDLAGAAK